MKNLNPKSALIWYLLIKDIQINSQKTPQTKQMTPLYQQG